MKQKDESKFVLACIVVNLSSKSQSGEIEAVLAKGLNFALSPKVIPVKGEFRCGVLIY